MTSTAPRFARGDQVLTDHHGFAIIRHVYARTPEVSIQQYAVRPTGRRKGTIIANENDLRPVYGTPFEEARA